VRLEFLTSSHVSVWYS